MYHLVVRSAFGGFAVGDMITDGTTVAAVLSDAHKRSFVVRVRAPDAPPAPQPEVAIEAAPEPPAHEEAQ